MPYFAAYINPLTENRVDTCYTYYTHYEIQTVREYETPAGDRYFEPYSGDEDQERAVGPVLFGVYGRLNIGGVQHITDHMTKEDAEEFLSRMGIAV